MPPKRPPEEVLAASSNKKAKTNNNNGPPASKQQQPKKGKQPNGASNKPGKGAQPFENRAANRERTRENRSIAVQKCDAALRDGELDVQSFLNARGFELNALDESMRRTRTNKTSRAFQRVPITLRRRAGAHNHKRVPKRLQNRAKREMEQDNTPTVNSRTRKSSSTRSRLRAETAKRLGVLAKRKRLRKLEKAGLDKETITVRTARPKIRKNALNKLPVTATRYRKRQLAKTWLPTHLWHTKRARMTDPKEPLWRFAVPLTPTAKCYRPTHRIQWEKGAMAWDMSYMSTISLSGPMNSVRNVLKALGLTHENLWNEKGARWRNGAIHWTCTLSRKKQGAIHVIGPATIVWNPETKTDDVESSKDFRRIFLRLHPSAFLETFDELLRLVKKQNPRAYIEDLRHEIGSIEITGPDSTEALLGILKPYFSKVESKEPHAAKFEKLAGCRDPASLPHGSLLGFSIVDPRLRYPPQKIPPAKPDIDILGDFHRDPHVNPFQLLDRDARFKASQLPSQKSLNRRKGRGAPGARLEPTTDDPPIPIILLASRHPTDSQAPGTWTLMLPWKCVLPVWYSLMHYPLSSGGNPRFGGLDEIRQLSFERGLPWFPGDMPGTEAGNAWEMDQRLCRQKEWERRPKGKRVNYETLDLGVGRKGEVGVGWNCDYELLLGLKNTDEHGGEQGDEIMAEDGTQAPSGPEGTEKEKIPEPVNPLESLMYLPKVAFNAHLSPKSEPLAPTSVITVRVKLLSRGTPSTCARIYRLPDEPKAAVSTQAEVSATDPPYLPKAGDGKLPPDLRAQWLAQKPGKQKKPHATGAVDLETRMRMLARELIGQQPAAEALDGHGHPLCPDAADLVGFVTGGGFNLRDGRGAAVGTLSARAAADELRRYGTGNRDHPAARLCVVRNAGESVGRLARWELV
ncbi:hypothetical protein DL769_009343 [Monosporascus sp. CRB-8-3]|nr:hypothetical protein DL769_009343 [Monosporascus sp. CRB-8-3]